MSSNNRQQQRQRQQQEQQQEDEESTWGDFFTRVRSSPSPQQVKEMWWYLLN